MNYKGRKPYCTERGTGKETQLLPKSKSNYGLGHIAESAMCTRKQEMRFVRAGVIRAVPERGQREDSTVHPERGEREDMTIYWLLWHWYGRLVFLHYIPSRGTRNWRNQSIWKLGGGLGWLDGLRL